MANSSLNASVSFSGNAIKNEGQEKEPDEIGDKEYLATPELAPLNGSKLVKHSEHCANEMFGLNRISNKLNAIRRNVER
jgi:hypothetical protein